MVLVAMAGPGSMPLGGCFSRSDPFRGSFREALRPPPPKPEDVRSPTGPTFASGHDPALQAHLLASLKTSVSVQVSAEAPMDMPCYQLFALDVLLDSAQTLHLIDLQASPSLAPDEPVPLLASRRSSSGRRGQIIYVPCNKLT